VSSDVLLLPVLGASSGRREGEGKGELVRETKSDVELEAESMIGEGGMKRVPARSGDPPVRITAKDGGEREVCLLPVRG